MVFSRTVYLGIGMVARIFASVQRMFPGVRKILWIQLYELIARLYRNRHWTFMNYGYAPVGAGDSAPQLHPADESERSCIQLYHHLVERESLKGKDVIEIGCGRGGGCSYIRRYLSPRSVCGVDLSRNVVRYCRERHRLPSLRFEVGDSENLPFSDESCDVVVNVESSHCYPSMERFLAEVRRVLRPGGTFHIADLRDSDQVAAFHRALEGSGLRIQRRIDITRNVLEAMRVDGRRRVSHFRKTLPRLVVRYFREFAGDEVSVIYRKFVQNRIAYLSYQLSKA